MAAVAGGLILVSHIPQRITAARTDEASLRESSWSPIYGLAQTCAQHLQAGAGILLLDPTARPAATDPASRTGPAAFGDPNDVDWPNQAAFAYSVYPHAVTALGHLPAGQGWLNGQNGYIAVWQQADYRTLEARDQAATARATLRASPGVVELCSYSDRLGDTGAIFASRALINTTELDPTPPLGHSSVWAYAATLLGLACIWLVGAVLLRLTGPATGFPLLAGALPLGCFAMSLEMLAFSTAGIRWSPTVLLLPWLPFAALALWRARVWRPNTFSLRAMVSGLGRRWRSLDHSERVAMVALASLVALIAALAPLRLPESDGFNLYYFKARAFFADGSVIPYYNEARRLLFSFPAHPPLVPLAVTWLYLMIGHVDEHATLLLWPAWFSSLLATMYTLVRSVVSRQAALWYTMAAALVAYELSSSALGGGYTDMPLAVFLLLGAGSLWAWAGSRGGSAALLVQTGLFLGAAALTKEEGLLAAPVVLAAGLLLRWRQESLGSALRAAAVSGAVFVAVVVLWLVLRRVYHLPVLTVDLGARLEFVLGRMIPAAAGVGVRTLPHLVLAVAVVAAAAVVTRSRRVSLLAVLSSRFWFVVAIVVTLLGFDALAIASAPVEVHYQISIAATRLISQVLPLGLLALIEPWRVAWGGR